MLSNFTDVISSYKITRFSAAMQDSRILIVCSQRNFYTETMVKLLSPTRHENNDGDIKDNVWRYVAPEVAELLLNVSKYTVCYQ